MVKKKTYLTHRELDLLDFFDGVDTEAFLSFIEKRNNGYKLLGSELKNEYEIYEQRLGEYLTFLSSTTKHLNNNI